MGDRASRGLGALPNLGFGMISGIVSAFSALGDCLWNACAIDPGMAHFALGGVMGMNSLYDLTALRDRD